jgi:aspartyl-tRNA(Asn)/glutamyl-tRNA(Gln) amidotransferase subunit A
MSDLLGSFPRLFPKPEHTIKGIARALRSGKTTCTELLQSCLSQIDEWESRVHAWVVLDTDRALVQASSLDEELKGGKDRGPLHGIPIAIKDMIDVEGLPTLCGSKQWGSAIAASDADIVANLRENGAVIMGKAVTTPYAWIDPPSTRNPWNLERSPGGSSSGPAAAVACGMCLGAIGTQTGGSITRPASFCGVAGMKPLYSPTSARQGVWPLAPSLDHVGPIAHSAGDLYILRRAMQGPIEDLGLERESPLGRQSGPMRLGRPRGFFDRRAEPVARAAFEEAVAALARCGAEIVDLDDPVDFEQILQDHRRVLAAEAALIHSARLDRFAGDYPPRIRELILEGRSGPALEYLKALKPLATEPACSRAIVRLGIHALGTPAAPGTAPVASTTGDPAFNSPWSYMRLPTVSIPTGLAGDGLPVAIQLVGPVGNETGVLSTAEWCEQAIRDSRQ